MKFSKDHKPTGEHAQKAALPDNLRIVGAIHVAGETMPLTKGFEQTYRETNPSVADVKRLVAAGALRVMDGEGNLVEFDVEAAEVETVEGDQPKPKTLDDGTVPQLKKLAEREGIDLGKATKKDDIIDLIVKGRKANAALFSLDGGDPADGKGNDDANGNGDGNPADGDTGNTAGADTPPA